MPLITKVKERENAEIKTHTTCKLYERKKRAKKCRKKLRREYRRISKRTENVSKETTSSKEKF